MSIKVYNTLSKKKEMFLPIEKGMINMYVCGPTVYDYSHLGHAKGYVSMDVIRRYLEWRGYKVNYVQNFTDVGHLTDDADAGEDKIVKRAKEKKIDPMKMVDKYINAYYEDFRALNVKDPVIAPRPSQHIPETIDFIEGLISKGYAYEINGSVYFDVSKFKEYGKLSGRKLKDLIAGNRVEVKSEKRNPTDFALWIKAEPNHILKWNSPWSVGYPGWHIECSVMSYKYFGETFDIHGGGNENIFPHNEDEIAQTEAFTGKPMCNYWLHWNMVKINGEKMSKSKGNFTTVRELLSKWDGEIIRLGILKTHYKSTVDFSEEMFEESKKNIHLLRELIADLLLIDKNTPSSGDVLEIIESTRTKFINSMDDDFNTPLALSAIFTFVKNINKRLNKLSTSEAGLVTSFLWELDVVLGLRLDRIRPFNQPLPKYLSEQILERQDARKRGDWQTADSIRDELLKQGIELQDTPDGIKHKNL